MSTMTPEERAAAFERICSWLVENRPAFVSMGSMIHRMLEEAPADPEATAKLLINRDAALLLSQIFALASCVLWKIEEAQEAAP